MLTREYLDARPDGWVDYAPQRIAQLYGSYNLASPAWLCHYWYGCIVLVCCKHLVMKSLITIFISLGGPKNAIIRLFVKKTSIYYCQQNLPFIHSSFVRVLLLEILEIFWRLNLGKKLIAMMLFFVTMRPLLMRYNVSTHQL